jgi:hypothetical protein
MQISIAADGGKPVPPSSLATVFLLALSYFSLRSLGVRECRA